MGYTPGYENAYIYGPTVVYGTGFYYNPWFNGFYYPRPWSWGFGFGYNPYVGWSIGYGYGFGWFHFGWGAGVAWLGRLGWLGGGWWGPQLIIRLLPGTGTRSTGFYGPGFARNRNVFINNYHTNIYASRPGVITRDNHSFVARSGSPGITGGRPGGAVNGGRPGANNVFTDRAGNVYQRNAADQSMAAADDGQFMTRPVQNNSAQRRTSTGSSRCEPRSGAGPRISAGQISWRIPVIGPAPGQWWRWRPGWTSLRILTFSLYLLPGVSRSCCSRQICLSI
jgi:hypothetical protein